MKPGQAVTWAHQPRGGYGYILYVQATIIKINKKTVRIAAKLANGGTKEVNVNPAHLHALETICDECHGL